MISLNYVYYFYFVFILHGQDVWTYQCLKCATKFYDHLVTIDDLSSPTYDDCNIVNAFHGCYIQLDWFTDGTSELHYTTNPELPYDSILTIIERRVILDTNEYSTQRSIGYSCRSNRTACNTIDNLKRVMIAIKFPTDERIQRFDNLILPKESFNGSSCSQFSNMINCPQPDLIHCRQCMSVVQYSRYLDICSTCSMEKFQRNFFVYRTIISVNTPSRSERITMTCQRGNNCNSVKNIRRIKRILTIDFHSEKFSRSIAPSTTKSTVTLLFIVIVLNYF
jgi:hypothetical protein